MSKESNPNRLVTLELCNQRHESLIKQVGELSAEVEIIRNALVGPDLRGGIVKDIQQLKSMSGHSLSGRDKAIVIVAVLGSISAFITALLSYYK